MEWLKITEDGEIEFVNEEVKLVPEVQALLSLEYNKQEGDTQGRFRKRAKNEMKYMYLAYSLKGPYRDYSASERIQQARIDCRLPVNWEESTELKLVINKYTDASPNKITRLLHTAEKTVDKLRNFLEEIDLNERTANDTLVHSTASVLKTLYELPSVAQALTELERQARTDTIQRIGSKGDHELGWMAQKGGKKNDRDISRHTKEDTGEVQ